MKLVSQVSFDNFHYSRPLKNERAWSWMFKDLRFSLPPLTIFEENSLFMGQHLHSFSLLCLTFVTCFYFILSEFFGWISMAFYWLHPWISFDFLYAHAFLIEFILPTIVVSYWTIEHQKIISGSSLSSSLTIQRDGPFLPF